MTGLNETHDPALRSWVESAQRPGCDFPIQNLPHGVFRRRGSQERFRGGVAIGDQILDIGAAAELWVFDENTRAAAWHAAASSLNGLMASGPGIWSSLRRTLSRLLQEDAPQAGGLRSCLVAQDMAEYAVPARIGDYTDFFTSPWHALNAGRIFQPANPMLPNFKWLPIGYHGRASSIEVSGTPCRRPRGQSRAPGADMPTDGPSLRLDYELELGAFIGPGNCRGEPIPIDAAEDHLFGLCLLNDWSARDLQAWESLPLGPFLSKSFLTTVSPWVVTLEALAPFRCALPRWGDDPPTLAYLRHGDDRARNAFDIQLEAHLLTAEMGAAGMPAARLSRTSFRHAYWSPAQWVAHHTHNGCNLLPGDLLGSGTQSGPTPGEEGCLLELGHGGTRPVELPSGQSRCFLEDGDTVILRAWCERDGHARIGFGACTGTVLPARA